MGVSNHLTDKEIIQMLQKEVLQLKDVIKDRDSTIFTLRQQLWDAERRADEASSRTSLWQILLKK